jgi:hypothetical protein
MEWLAVKYQQDNTLFLQNRSERETSNSAHIDMNKLINTVVVKTFIDKVDAIKYIKDINAVNKLIDAI